jgi:hypothetical protein
MAFTGKTAEAAQGTNKGHETSVTVRVRARGAVKVTVTVKPGKGPVADCLEFGNGNAKLDPAIFTFSLPAGHTCPAARDCQASADRHTGRVADGPETTFRCYAASMEARHPNVRACRWHNFDLLRGKTKDQMAALILNSLSPYAGFVRVHDGGDFWSQDYFDAWMDVARRRPHTRFYAYTKSLTYWAAKIDHIPVNFVLTASRGGRHDSLIDRYGLRFARVVFSEGEAEALGLEIDDDDSHAMHPGPSFALLIHGTQPGGSEAAKAVAALRAAGEFGYGERADQSRRKRVPLALLG